MDDRKLIKIINMLQLRGKPKHTQLDLGPRLNFVRKKTSKEMMVKKKTVKFKSANNSPVHTELSSIAPLQV